MASKTKTFTLEEVDKLTLHSEHLGFVNGMATCYKALIKEVDQLQNSISDVWAMYYLGEMDDHKLAVTADMKVVSNAITHLKDVLEGAYYDTLDKRKIDDDKEDFARAWREDIASSKEEWPL